LIISYTKI